MRKALDSDNNEHSESDDCFTNHRTYVCSEETADTFQTATPPQTQLKGNHYCNIIPMDSPSDEAYQSPKEIFETILAVVDGITNKIEFRTTILSECANKIIIPSVFVEDITESAILRETSTINDCLSFYNNVNYKEISKEEMGQHANLSYMATTRGCQDISIFSLPRSIAEGRHSYCSERMNTHDYFDIHAIDNSALATLTLDGIAQTHDIYAENVTVWNRRQPLETIFSVCFKSADDTLNTLVCKLNTKGFVDSDNNQVSNSNISLRFHRDYRSVIDIAIDLDTKKVILASLSSLRAVQPYTGKAMQTDNLLNNFSMQFTNSEVSINSTDIYERTNLIDTNNWNANPVLMEAINRDFLNLFISSRFLNSKNQIISPSNGYSSLYDNNKLQVQFIDDPYVNFYHNFPVVNYLEQSSMEQNTRNNNFQSPYHDESNATITATPSNIESISNTFLKINKNNLKFEFEYKTEAFIEVKSSNYNKANNCTSVDGEAGDSNEQIRIP